MSEEQKEYEANKLANIIDRLHSLGVVKPGKLGTVSSFEFIYILPYYPAKIELNFDFKLKTVGRGGNQFSNANLKWVH